MNKLKKWAEKLDGREYLNELTEEEEKEALQDNVLIVYGYSDDDLELRGIIDDEIGAWNGTSIYIGRKNNKLTWRFIQKENDYMDHDDEEEYDLTGFKKCGTIIAEFAPINEKEEVYATWSITTDMKHEKFNIMEDGELFCSGVVISL